MGVPATYLFLAQAHGFAEADLSSLRLAVVGGAPMPESLLETWVARGVEIVQGYGLTEAAPNVLCLPPEDARRKLGFAGKPYPHDVALRDPESGALVEGAGVGELVVRGGTSSPVTGGTRRPRPRRSPTGGCSPATSPSATRRASTGSPEGSRRWSSRAARTCTRRRSRTSCTTIRPVLEAAVVGVPDERWGEACAAFVVLREGGSATDEALREHCRPARRGSLSRRSSRSSSAAGRRSGRC